MTRGRLVVRVHCFEVPLGEPTAGAGGGTDPDSVRRDALSGPQGALVHHRGARNPGGSEGRTGPRSLEGAW